MPILARMTRPMTRKGNRATCAGEARMGHLKKLAVAPVAPVACLAARTLVSKTRLKISPNARGGRGLLIMLPRYHRWLALKKVIN